MRYPEGAGPRPEVATWNLWLADQVQQPPGAISDRLRADPAALARGGNEDLVNVPGERRD